MTVRQAGAPVTDAGLDRAAAQGMSRRFTAEFPSDPRLRMQCRFYPKLSFFFGRFIHAWTICDGLPCFRGNNGTHLHAAPTPGDVHDARMKMTSPCFTPLRAFCLAACAMLAVSACAPALPDDPLASDHPLWMVPVNHVGQWAVNMVVDRYGMGGAPPHGGGGARACCYPGPRDWSKPVTIHWEWDTVVAPNTKVVPPTEPHSMVVHFPPGGPAKDDRYLCLILRDRDTAELAFSRVASHCATK